MRYSICTFVLCSQSDRQLWLAPLYFFNLMIPMPETTQDQAHTNGGGCLNPRDTWDTIHLLYCVQKPIDQGALTGFLPKCLWSKQQRADQYSVGLCVPCKPTWYPPEGGHHSLTEWEMGELRYIPRQEYQVSGKGVIVNQPCMELTHRLLKQFNCRLLFLALTPI